MAAPHETKSDTGPRRGETPGASDRGPVGGRTVRSSEPVLVLSFDLEEFYGADGRPAGSATPLPDLVATLLLLLREARACATFFTVGDVARDHSELVRRIAADGHEIACHGDRHVPLFQLGPDSFARDLARNREAITVLGLPAPRGFRAPMLSLGPAQAWAHAVMRDGGIEYSSSVMPARVARVGWPGFGSAPRECDGVLEIPVTIEPWGPLRIPCFCGVFYRLLPAGLAARLITRASGRGAVVGYLHPYDFDASQPWTWHLHFRGRPFMNHLLFVRRGSILRRLERLLSRPWTIRSFAEQVAVLRDARNDGPHESPAAGEARRLRRESA